MIAKPNFKSFEQIDYLWRFYSSCKNAIAQNIDQYDNEFERAFKFFSFTHTISIILISSSFHACSVDKMSSKFLCRADRIPSFSFLRCSESFLLCFFLFSVVVFRYLFERINRLESTMKELGFWLPVQPFEESLEQELRIDMNIRPVFFSNFIVKR